MELRLVQNEPAPRAPSPSLEGGTELFSERARDRCVSSIRSRLDHQLPVEELRDQMRGQGKHVRVGRPAPNRLGHGPRLAQIRLASTVA